MKKNFRRIGILVAAVMMIAAFFVSASAASSIEDQMAANSAAWWIAYHAGDQATMDALHAANEALAKQAASGGSASYDDKTGTWDITTSSGSSIKSSGSSSGGKSNTVTYSTTTSSGSTSSTSDSTYSKTSISTYKGSGGTNSGLANSYNNAAAKVNITSGYGGSKESTSAEDETNVVQALYGLSDSETETLQRELESQKQAYYSAQSAYAAAVQSGDSAAAAAAQAAMNAAHAAAQDTRAQYNYTGDITGEDDGAYFHGDFLGGAAPAPNTPHYNTPTGTPTYTPSYPTYYAITSSAGTGGSISPSGTATVTRGSSKTYTVSPNTGYDISSVTVDGSNKGAISSYTFSNITSGHSISASFVKKTFSITASAGTGGSISPAGTATVSYGDSKTFTFAPDWGYKVADVIVDGTSKGAVSSYTFSNVTGPHSISVKFEPCGKITLGDADVTDSLGGAVDGDGIKSGYGIYAEVDAEYSYVTDLSLTVSYDFGFGRKTVSLQEVSSGVFEYPVNADSPTGQRCVYIPVETADGSYTLTFTMSARNAAGELLTKTTTARVVVRGSMYEDDFTGDS